MNTGTMSSPSSAQSTKKSAAQALVSIAIIGKDNDPLYIRDFPLASRSTMSLLPLSGDSTDSTEDDDPFGYTLSSKSHTSCLRYQFMIHAVLDAFEDQIELRSLSLKNADTYECYMGLLCPVDELRVYGYMTKTGVKMIAMLEDTLDFYQFSRESNAISSEAEMKSLFAKIHVLYVEHCLNPFSKLKGQITSKRFDDGIIRHVNMFNASL